jgi:protein Hikeshi
MYPQPQPHPQQAPTPFFGLIIPGRPVRTDFSPIDATGLKFAVTLTCPGDIPAPMAMHTQLVLFWTQSTPFPPGQGVLCYWQIATTTTTAANTNAGAAATAGVATGFQLLGAITEDCSSRVFQTGWSEHEELMELFAKPNAPPVTVTIALSVEPLSNIQNMGAAAAPTSAVGGNGFDGANTANLMHTGTTSTTSNAASSRRLFVAQKIALDLFRFMQSFDTGHGGPGQMLVPNTIFDRWYKRFENRFQSTSQVLSITRGVPMGTLMYSSYLYIIMCACCVWSANKVSFAFL